ncbi:unnamed protein product [Calypogeia fissa]
MEHPVDNGGEDYEVLRATPEEKVPFLETKSSSEAGDAFSRSYSLKLFLHMLTSFFIVAHLAAFTYYLFVKTKLYVRNAAEVLAAPWLLLFLYFTSSLIAAVDNLLPPSTRPDLQLDGRYYPTVHILLPCCQEPTDVPVDSLHAALKLDYPVDRFKVLVLDDGGDDELKAISETLQVETGGQVVYLDLAF